MRPVELLSERLLLSAPTLDDVDAITRYASDPSFERWLTTPWPYTRADAEEFTDRLVPTWWEQDLEYTFGIRSQQGGLLGMISWRRRGDVGFWMGAEHRGQGYMVEALAAVCEWVFVEFPVSRIDWETLPGNVASARVARAAGFRYTGIAPVVIPARDGTFPDSWHGELRREDDRDPKDGWPL